MPNEPTRTIPAVAAARSAVCLALLVVVVVFGNSATARAGAAQATKAKSPEALSRQLCDALQELPVTRKGQCCATSPTGSLAGECVRKLGEALRRKAITLDAADVERCARDSASALEGCGWVTPYLPRTPASCVGVIHGRLEAGARCRSSLECRDGLSCRGGSPTESGVCVPPGPPGASCGGGGDPLATYARQGDEDPRHPQCAGYCIMGRCAPFVRVGAKCSADRQCLPGAHCAAHRCVEGPRPALGEACDETTCEGGLVCIAGRCAHPKKSGEACTQAFECEGVCLSPTADKPGTCGMKCSTWPPAGYTPPLHAPASSDAAQR